jgi:uncharacterized DUF497 family protein
METEFDDEKDQINQDKHGISLAAAAGIDFDMAKVIPDERFDYGEQRFWRSDRSADGCTFLPSPCAVSDFGRSR